MLKEMYIMLMFFLPVGVMVAINLLITMIFKGRDKDAILIIRWCCVLSSFILCYYSVLMTLFLLIALVFITAYLESRKIGSDNALMEFYKYIHESMNKKPAAANIPEKAEIQN